MWRTRRTWIVGALVALVIGAGLVRSFALRSAASLTAVKQALSGRASRVAVRMAVDRPERPGQTDTFNGSGIIFGDGRASLTYDFSSLPNAGGFFGHLSEFEMLVTDESLYLEVPPGERPWLLVDDEELEEFERVDLERLREVVLASPYLVDTLLRADELTAGPDTVTVASSVSELTDEVDGFSLATLEVLDLIGTDPIKAVFTVDRASSPTSVRYELAFPVARGAADKVVVTVTVDFEEIGFDSELREPGDAEVTTFVELKREGTT